MSFWNLAVMFPLVSVTSLLEMKFITFCSYSSRYTSRHKVLCQQDRHLQPRPGKKTERNKHCQTDNQEQQIRNLNLEQNPQQKRETRTRQQKEVGKIHIHREGNKIRHETFQKHRRKSNIHYKQQPRKTFSLKNRPKIRKIRWGWGIPTRMPHLQQEVSRPKRTTIQSEILRTLQRLQAQTQQI
jgi:hypothetical protein